MYYRYGDKWVDMMTYSPDRMNVRRTLGIMYQEFALYAGETILDQIAYQMGIKGNDVIDHARAMAEELGISDKVLDVIYAMTDMSEEDAKAAFEALGLTRDIFKDLFPRFPTTEARKFAEPIFDLMSLDQGGHVEAARTTERRRAGESISGHTPGSQAKDTDSGRALRRYRSHHLA